MDILKKIQNAGVVGAGGAGFPTHVKLDCNVEFVIANGAECEPLLQADLRLMESEAGAVVEGLSLAMKQVGAKEGIIFIKSHYKEAAQALTKQIEHNKSIRLHISKNYYPAGDEQQVIYEVTRRVVPPGDLPKDIGAVVLNVSTIIDIANALKDIPVTKRYITVAGAIKNPQTLQVPIGTPMIELINMAGAVAQDDNAYIIGGPCMGTVIDTLEGHVVTKTTNGLLVIPRAHPLLHKKSVDIRFKAMLSVCCQCNMCTQMCPRNALGLGTSPHKAMRSIASGVDLIGNVNSILTCCDCGVCTYHACNFGLNPALIMNRLKQEMMTGGIRPNPQSVSKVDSHIDFKRLSTQRLLARLGLTKYDSPAPICALNRQIMNVKIPLKMHIGSAALPTVIQGDYVRHGTLIASPPEKTMGANIHASIDGVVKEITSDYIEIEK